MTTALTNFFQQLQNVEVRSGETGFHVQFDNGLVLSVQWGTGNYADLSRQLFETAVFLPNWDLFQLPGDNDTVRGWQSIDDVRALAQLVADMNISLSD